MARCFRLSPPSWRALVFSALAVALSPPVRAEDVELPPVTAVGQAPAEPSEAQAKDPSGFVTVVEAPRGEASSAAELVAASPGVTVRDFGVNQPTTVSVRGSTADQVVVLLDGMPLNAAGGGGADLSTLPAPFVERVSVARGAVGARYGAGALGGAVSLETRKPSPGERRLFAELEYGSFSSMEAFLGASSSVGERSSALVAAYARRCEGDYPYLHDEAPLLEGNPLVERRWENNASLRAGALGRLLVDGPVGVDLLVEADGGARGVPGTVQNPTPDAEQRDARGMMLARLSRTFGETPVELRVGGRLSRTQWSPSRASPLDPQLGAVAFAELGAQRLWGRHAVEASVRIGHESLDGPAYGAHGRLLLSLFAGDEILVGPLSLLPALRAEGAGEIWGLSPKLGATLALGERVTLKANAGRSFRPPSFGELYLEQGVFSANPDLRPETASFADLGIAVGSESLRGTVSGFYTLYDDLILYELYAAMRAKPFNFGKAEVYGAEAELSASLGPATFSAAYTLGLSANRIGDERFFNQELPYHPRHRFHARAEVRLWRVSAHADLDAQSAQYTNRNRTDSLPGRARADAGLSVLAHRGAGLYVHGEVKNLFDQRGQDLYGYPLPGRSVFVGLRLDLSSTDSSRSNR